MRMRVQSSVQPVSIHCWAAQVKSQLLELKLQTITAEVGVVNNVKYFYFYFFPDRPTLFSFCQCLSNNISNRYGLNDHFINPCT